MNSRGIIQKIFPDQSTVRTLITYNALQGLYLGYINVFWQPFLITLGISVALIAILEATAGQYGILASLVQSFGGLLSDRIGRRKVVISGSALLVTCWSIAASAFIFRIQLFAIPAYVFWSLGALSIPALDAVLADTVRADARTRVYSVILVANFLPSALTGYLAGQYSSSLGASTFLAIAAILEGSGLMILLLRLSEHSHTRSNEVRTDSSMKQVLVNIRLHWKYFVVISADSLTWTIGSSLLYALLQESQSFSKQDFGMIALALPLGLVFGTIPGGWLATKIGPRNLLIFSEFLGAGMMLGWAIYPLPSMIPVYGFSWGAAISTWVPVQFQLSSHFFPQHSRGELMGNLGTARGLVRGIGPIIAVSLFLTLGYAAPLIAGSLGILLTIVLIIKFIPSKVTIVDEKICPATDKH